MTKPGLEPWTLFQLSYQGRYLMFYYLENHSRSSEMLQILLVWNYLRGFIGITSLFVDNDGGLHTIRWKRTDEYQKIILIWLYRLSEQLFFKSWENLFMLYANNKGADQPGVRICAVWSAPLLFTAWIVSISEISIIYTASVAGQARLCRTWSQTTKTGFLVRRLILRNAGYLSFVCNQLYL